MILYHVTASKNVAGILKRGLIPQIGAYAKEMGETEALVWLFPSLEDAVEMASVWMAPYYGESLAIIEANLDDNFLLEHTGSDYELVSRARIPGERLRIL